MKYTIVAMVVLLMMAIHVEAPAQPPGDGKGRMERFREARQGLVEQLNLTDTQAGQFKKLRLDHERKMLQNRNKLSEARLDLKALYMADKPDRGAIEKGLRTISDIQHQQKLAMVEHWFAVNAILSPEQQKLWKEHAGRMGPGGKDDARGPGKMRGHRQRGF